MDLARFNQLLALHVNAADRLRAKLRRIFRQDYERHLRSEIAEEVSYTINAIVDKTGWDQKEIAQWLGVSPQALCAWKKDGSLSLLNYQRLRDLAEDTDVLLRGVPYASARRRQGILAGMRFLALHAGPPCSCDVDEELLDWIAKTPFELWAKETDNPRVLDTIFRQWMAACPRQPGSCTRQDGDSLPEHLFYKWTPTYLACRDELPRFRKMEHGE